MLFSHVHVTSGVGCVFFAAVVQAWKFLLELLSTPSNVFLALVLPPSVPHLNIVYQIVHQHMPMVLSALNFHTGLRNACTLLIFEVICLDWIDILWTYAKLGDVRNFKRLKYLLRLLVTLASWALDDLVVEMALVSIAWLRSTLLHSLLACFVRAISLDKLRNKLFADLRGALMC